MPESRYTPSPRLLHPHSHPWVQILSITNTHTHTLHPCVQLHPDRKHCCIPSPSLGADAPPHQHPSIPISVCRYALLTMNTLPWGSIPRSKDPHPRHHPHSHTASPGADTPLRHHPHPSYSPSGATPPPRRERRLPGGAGPCRAGRRRRQTKAGPYLDAEDLGPGGHPQHGRPRPRRRHLRQLHGRTGRTAGSTEAVRLSSDALGSTRGGSARLGLARLGSARPGSAELGSARLGWVRFGSAGFGWARAAARGGRGTGRGSGSPAEPSRAGPTGVGPHWGHAHHRLDTPPAPRHGGGGAWLRLGGEGGDSEGAQVQGVSTGTGGQQV